MARIPFVRHRTANQIRSAYRSCRHPVEKVRWHAIWLLARTDEPRTPARVAAVVGLSDITVRAGLHRWNAHGPAGRTDRRRDALRAAIPTRPPDGGVWSGPKAVRYIRRHWHIESMHWVLDVAFREDESRTQAGHAGANLGMIRRVAVSLLRRTGTKGSVHTRRLRAAWDDKYLIQVLRGLSTHSA